MDFFLFIIFKKSCIDSIEWSMLPTNLSSFFFFFLKQGESEGTKLFDACVCMFCVI